ncbi:MAG TPA: class I SAM-dependent methyltransferase [Bacilli bacterium]|nr:class I SAM-dependent methyltransferase [Bacilli bacterium]
MKEVLIGMEEYAKEKNIPIIEKDSIAFIMKYIKKKEIKEILEIGSAIGYSAILMASAYENTKVTTIEKDEQRYIECLNNVKKCKLESKINVVFQDTMDLNLIGVSYDLIFIDAAKGDYLSLFEKYKYFLKPNGVIITDNLNFHGYVKNKKDIQDENLRKIVERIEEYVDFLKNNKDYESEFIDVGDGLSVTSKRE